LTEGSAGAEDVSTMTTTTTTRKTGPVVSSVLFPPSLRKYGVLLVVAPVLICSFARAQILDIRFLDNGLFSGEWTPSIINTGGGYMVNDVTYHSASATISCYNMTLGYDPFLSASVNVVNTTATIQHYTLIFTLPISPAILGGSLMGGSTQGGVTDGNFDGAGTLATFGPGTAMYHGQIDGLDALPLFGYPTSIVVPFAGGSASSSASAGLPGVTIPGPNVLTSIGIKEDFTLTPGDSATFTSFFVVNQAVPEPGTLSLLGIGGLVLLFRRRR